MALTVSQLVKAQVVGTRYKRAELNVTFDSSYPNGVGEIIDFSAYDFVKVANIFVDNGDNGIELKLSGTKASGYWTASATTYLKAFLNKPWEVSGTVAHDATLFDAAATTDSAVLFQQPAGSNVVGIELGVGAQFVATSMTALTMEVGDGSDADGYFDGTLDLVADAVGTTDTTKGVLFVPSVYKQAATNWTATATATGANLSTTSAGSMTYSYFYYPEDPDGNIGGPGISEVPNGENLSTKSFTLIVEGY